MSLTAYKALATLLGPAIDLYLDRRVLRGKEDPSRLDERRGIPGIARPEGSLVWFHAASVGESVALLPLIERLATDRPDLTLLVTTGTMTSAKTMAQRLPVGTIHQFVPVDRPAWVRRFLKYWRPSLGIWCESDLWPALVTQAKQRGVKLVLVDGRLSEGAFRRWRMVRNLARPLFSAFDLVLASSVEQAERFHALGAADCRFVGSLKAAGAPPPVDEDVRAALSRAIGDRPVWLAANTHPGEDKVVLDAHSALAKRWPNLLTILAPRHPQRGADITALAQQRGFGVVQRSTGVLPGPSTAVYVADTLGEMGTLYATSPITFLAGSLASVGGHNPIEPAHAGTALLLGPLMPNNRNAADALLAADAALPVSDAASLAEAVAKLLDDAAATTRMGKNARRVARDGQAGLKRIVEALAPLLPPQAGS